MSIWEAVIDETNQIDEKSKLVMYEKRIVHTKLFGIPLKTLAYERSSSKYIGDITLSKMPLGFGSKD